MANFRAFAVHVDQRVGEGGVGNKIMFNRGCMKLPTECRVSDRAARADCDGISKRARLDAVLLCKRLNCHMHVKNVKLMTHL